MQVENEYGSYGNDKEYLKFIAELMRDCGVKELLFTSDGPQDDMLSGGTLPDILKVANFGSRASASFRKLKEYQASRHRACAVNFGTAGLTTSEKNTITELPLRSYPS